MGGRVQSRLPEVSLQHDLDQFGKRRAWAPVEDGCRLRGITAQLVYLGGPEVARVHLDIPVRVEADGAEGSRDEVTYRVHLTSRDDEVISLGLLEDPPHRL